MISGSQKHAWSKCKASIQLFDPNWGNKGLDYGGWFTWSNFRQSFARVQARLDRIYGSRDDISFSKNMCLVDVFIAATGLDNLPFMTSILVNIRRKTQVPFSGSRFTSS